MKKSAVSTRQTANGGRRSKFTGELFRREFFRWRRMLFCLLTIGCLSLAARAQTEESVDDEMIAPPPLKILSKDEKSQLSSTPDVKDRTKLALELMEARLLSAEGLAAKEQYPEMFNELGGFHALMDDTLNFLKRSNNNSGKVLNNFKRIELNLRKYITRLELIRRELPIKYERYVRQLTKYVREARSAAIDPLFGESVVPSNKPE